MWCSCCWIYYYEILFSKDQKPRKPKLTKGKGKVAEAAPEKGAEKEGLMAGYDFGGSTEAGSAAASGIDFPSQSTFSPGLSGISGMPGINSTAPAFNAPTAGMGGFGGGNYTGGYPGGFGGAVV